MHLKQACGGKDSDEGLGFRVGSLGNGECGLRVGIAAKFEVWVQADARVTGTVWCLLPGTVGYRAT